MRSCSIAAKPAKAGYKTPPKRPANPAAGFDGHMRLCFAWEEEWKLEEGVRRVERVASSE